jgi:hypothetical protein
MTDVLSRVSFENLDAHLLKSIGGARALQVGTGNAEAEFDQHLGDTGHADATDANKMNVLYPSKHPLNPFSR